ncbi:MAG: hypothetical protein QOE55_7711 [Acidobacteriaceae bacterium]|jgi:hypothetical protein|nr:hypothetical protein [Acidobacteriaceae bacterium]
MIIHCLSFGTLWWLRPGNDRESAARFTSHAAVFNTTGFASGSRERRSWIVPGVVRFNAGTCLEQRIRPEQAGQGRFVSPGVERNGSQNRLLLTRKVTANAPADLLLACITCKEHGRISFDSEWRSRGVRLLTASEFRGKQESLVLLPAGGHVTTTLGKWRCEWTGSTATLTRTAETA